MDWINYHHLLYFYTVVRCGSMARAAEELNLTQPTLSSQIAKLERSLGEKLLTRVGRRLELTEAGKLAFGYAEEIFSLGKEMLQGLRGHQAKKPMRLEVGVADVLPKLVVFRLLEPILSLPTPVQLACREGKLDDLLDGLVCRKLDLVLTDAPADPTTRLPVFNHLLGECGISVCGAPSLATQFEAGFPTSLGKAPWLLPLPGTAIRRSLDNWFASMKFRPQVRGEFDDSALLKVFGQAGAGVFAVPTVVERDVVEKFGVRPIGRVESIRERFFAISVERRLEHPALVAIFEAAGSELFG